MSPAPALATRLRSHLLTSTRATPPRERGNSAIGGVALCYTDSRQVERVPSVCKRTPNHVTRRRCPDWSASRQRIHSPSQALATDGDGGVVARECHTHPRPVCSTGRLSGAPQGTARDGDRVNRLRLLAQALGDGRLWGRVVGRRGRGCGCGLWGARAGPSWLVTDHRAIGGQRGRSLEETTSPEVPASPTVQLVLGV